MKTSYRGSGLVVGMELRDPVYPTQAWLGSQMFLDSVYGICLWSAASGIVGDALEFIHF